MGDIYGQTLEDVARERENPEILRLLSEIKGRQRGQVFYAQRRIKGEKQREQNRLADKKNFDWTLVVKAKQELTLFLRNQNEEPIERSGITSNRVEEINVSGSQGEEDRRREVQARLNQLHDENKRKEQERRDRAMNSQEGASSSSESTFYKSMSIVEARKELERMEKENKVKLENSKREEEKKRK